MTDDPFLNFTICAGVVAILLTLVFIVGKADVANDCRLMGMTNIGGTVFECKEKNT